MTVFGQINKNSAQVLTFSVAGGNTVCPNFFNQACVTATPSGANNFSWTVTSSTCSPTFSNMGGAGHCMQFSSSCPSTLTITVSAYNNSTFVSSTTQTVLVSPSPVIVASQTAICAGSTVTLSVSGNNSYTWFPGSITASTIVVSPMVTTHYSAITNGLWCNNVAAQQIVVHQNPTVSIGGPQGICAGSMATLSANGAASYTWLPGNINSSILNLGNSLPPGTHCYTVIGANACGTGSAQHCLTVSPTPTLSVSGNNTTCIGSTLTLTAAGASSYSWTPLMSSAPTVTVNAFPGTLTLHGFSNGCWTSIPVTFTVDQISSSVTGNTLVCPGDTRTLSASGAVTYTWVTSSGFAGIGPSLVVSPTVTTCYTVTGTTANGCEAGSVECLIASMPSLNISTNTGGTVSCNSSGLNLIASGATNYTWLPGNSTSTVLSVNPTSSTCYTLIGSNGSCSGSVVKCISVSQPPAITPAPSVVNVCAGGQVTLATSSTSHTWVVISTSLPLFSLTTTFVSGTIVVVSPTANMLYTVTALNNSNNFCNSSAAITVSMIPAAQVSISGPGTTCPGDTLQLLGSGLTTYTWSNGSTGPLTVVSPTASTCYTLSGFNGQGCYGQAVKCITVHPTPNITISGSSTVCLGSPLSLTANGASSYNWSGGPATAANLVTPTTNTCYMVNGSNSFGCSSSAVHCVTVVTAPITIAASSQTVCEGTSATFTASGATSYNWSNSSTGATINVNPGITTSYTVTGTGSNGCSGSAFITLVVDTNCSDVWPGDANSDGIVNTFDVLQLGVHASATGASRSPGGNSYVAQYCQNWSGNMSNGKNICHADCNGDGVVNQGDTAAILLNFNQSHAFKSSGNASGNINVIAQSPYVESGEWSKVDIVIGDENNQVNNLYGVAFELSFDAMNIEPGSAYLVYTPSFLNAGSQTIDFRKMEFSNGKVYSATVRTDHSNVSGYGKIAELHFKAASGLAGGTAINFALSNTARTDLQGAIQTLSGQGTNVQINNNLVGLKNVQAHNISIYPNPASGQLTINAPATDFTYALLDISGRVLSEGNGKGNTQVLLTGFAKGTYMLSIEMNGTKSYKKVVIE